VPEEMQEEMQKNVIGWGRRAARAIGCSSAIQQQGSEDELLRIFAALDEHLNTHKFVFGDAPTAVDAVLMGGLRAHFLNDIYPKSLLGGYRNVREWHDTCDSMQIGPADETVAHVHSCTLIHSCTLTHSCTHTLMHTHTHSYTLIHTHTHSRTHALIHSCTLIHTHAHSCTLMHSYLKCSFIHMLISAYSYPHTHQSTHTAIPTPYTYTLMHTSN
jgi:hypothetical protein